MLPRFDSTMRRIASELKADPNHRELSWDHAHRHWNAFVGGHSKDKDLAALHLAFYLASFGMYRGSGPLLERDYKVLVPVVTFLAAQPRNAWRDCFFSKRPANELADELSELSIALGNELATALTKPKKLSDKTIRPSDTLISKIMLVTYDCVPAFDELVKAALKDILRRNYASVDAFASQRLIPVIELARENKGLIERGRQTLREKCGREYPLNRIFDLYLWHYGAVISKKDKSDKP